MYRILLADDEGIMLESLKKMIETTYGRECEIATAKTGRAVVELAETFRPDIAFMDIQMPGLSGVQAMREIRNSVNRQVNCDARNMEATISASQRQIAAIL